MRAREHEGSRARTQESMTARGGLTRALRALVGDVEGDGFGFRTITHGYSPYNLQTDGSITARDHDSTRR